MKMIKVTVREVKWWGKFLKHLHKMKHDSWETWINIDLIEAIRDERLDSRTSTEILLTSGTVYYVSETFHDVLDAIEDADR
jgi:uncharacterized protein YlzI (FlbEa/FlbD family)